MRWFRISVAALLVLIGAITAEARKPNFVVFLVDDLGFMDVAAYNPDTFYETPNVDRLAAQGMGFSHAYAVNPVCSPTRYSIMTGRYPSRVDATNFFAGRREGRFRPAPLHDRMPLEEITLGDALQEAGYRTAYVGKWHLGPSPEYWPEQRGFDVNIGGHDRGTPPGGYFSPFNNPRLEDGPEGEHLTERLTEEAIRLLDQMQHQPFLLYLSYYTVHTPLEAPEELVEKYRQKAANLPAIEPEFVEEEQVWPVDEPRQVRVVQNHPVYAAMVETMDRSVGRVLDKLSDLGLDESTVVFFTSDHGGLSTSEGHPTSNWPLRGGKGWLYEGGIRKPLLIRWPGVTQAGSVSHEQVVSMDLFPTILEMAGVQPRPGQVWDGVSLVPVLKGGRLLNERALFWHYPHYSNQGGFPGGAIRYGDFKLIERYEDGRVHLYNLREDVGEHLDLAEQMPERVDAMRQLLHAWYREVDAKFLRAHPDGAEPWRPWEEAVDQQESDE